MIDGTCTNENCAYCVWMHVGMHQLLLQQRTMTTGHQWQRKLSNQSQYACSDGHREHTTDNGLRSPPVQSQCAPPPPLMHYGIYRHSGQPAQSLNWRKSTAIETASDHLRSVYVRSLKQLRDSQIYVCHILLDDRWLVNVRNLTSEHQTCTQAGTGVCKGSSVLLTLWVSRGRH